MFGVTAVLVFMMLVFGFGFFFGRYEQIEINKSLLLKIPDVNHSYGQDE